MCHGTCVPHSLLPLAIVIEIQTLMPVRMTSIPASLVWVPWFEACNTSDQQKRVSARDWLAL